MGRGRLTSMAFVTAVSVCTATALVFPSACYGPPELPQGLREFELPDDPPRLRALLLKEPENLGAWRVLWWSVGDDPGERLQVARDCVAANPRVEGSHALMGAHWAYYGRDVDAEVSWRKALEINPASEVALGLGSILTRYGRQAQARELSGKALEAAIANSGASRYTLVSMAMQIHALGDLVAAAAAAKRMGGDSLDVWLLQAHEAAINGRMGEVLEPPAWTWWVDSGRKPLDAAETERGQSLRHEPLMHVLALMGAAGSPEELQRVEGWFRRGLDVYDDPEGREVCLTGLLVGSWLREGLKSEVKVPAEHDALVGRLTAMGGLALWLREALAGVEGAGDEFNAPHMTLLRTPKEAALRIKASLLRGELDDGRWRIGPMRWAQGKAADGLLELARREKSADYLWLAAARTESEHRRWGAVKECCGQLQRLLGPIGTPSKGADGADGKGDPSKAVPSWPELAREWANWMLLEARFFDGERVAVVAEVRAEEAKHPERAGQHWILRLDDYWREVEKRGLAKFPGE